MVRNVRVYLDNEMQEFSERVCCGFIVTENDRGEETHHTEMIDTYGYGNMKELVDDIAGLFHVSRSAVWVTD